MRKVTAKEWFDKVSSLTRHWDRRTDNELTLWFDGYMTQEAYHAENELRQLGGVVFDYRWYEGCGKTAMVLREPHMLIRD